MACSDCIECAEVLTVGAGSGSGDTVEGSGGEIYYFKEICAEDPNGASLYLVTAELVDFSPCGDNEMEAGIASGSGGGPTPDWFYTDPPAGESPAESGGELVAPGALFRLCVGVYVDAQAAFDIYGEGQYTIELVAARNDGEGEPITCEWIFCIEQGTIEEPAPTFTPNTVFIAGAADQGRLMSCDISTANQSMTTVIDNDPHPGIPFSSALYAVAFHNIGQKVYFTSSAAGFQDQVWRCDPDGTNVEVYHDFNNGEVIRELYIHQDSNLLYAGSTQGFIWELNLATDAVQNIWSEASGFASVNSLDVDDTGILWWSTRNGAGDTFIFKWDGVDVIEVVALLIQDDLPTLRYNNDTNELWGRDDTGGAGIRAAGLHVYAPDGTYLREEPDLNFLATANDFHIDNKNGYIFYIGGSTPADVFRIPLSDLTASTKVGNTSGSTGSILSMALAELPV